MKTTLAHLGAVLLAVAVLLFLANARNSSSGHDSQKAVGVPAASNTSHAGR
ncbi:exported hypothetical protein [Burkholderiales bacterium]|nr:exported hypothetical protein [Burkholderiales bacterium]